ncbi:hypothetical protein DID80_01245 [Candidatus Marinamargulisbacteria bacterium SCGC AAA071-K20]|nr:hypothetical protein DID80_01245 [Candidatus Marinamargulisbacteria bacterium SCGC AAA071-K20]
MNPYTTPPHSFDLGSYLNKRAKALGLTSRVKTPPEQARARQVVPRANAGDETGRASSTTRTTSIPISISENPSSREPDGRYTQNFSNRFYCKIEDATKDFDLYVKFKVAGINLLLQSVRQTNHVEEYVNDDMTLIDFLEFVGIKT